MKKHLLLTLVVVLALGMISGAVSAADTYKIGYSCNNFNDTFQTVIEGYAQAYAKEQGAEYVYADASEDVLKQQDQIKAFIAEGVNALIVVPVDTSAMEPVIALAEEAGVPLVFVNRTPFADIPVEEIPANTYYVGSESIDAGIFQADYLVELLGEDAEVGYAILVGMLSNEAAVARTEGNKQVLEKYPNYKLLAEKNGDWQRDQGLTITENWITAYGDELKAVLSNNDEMALGSVEALEAAGLKDKVIVMGVDLIDDAKVAIKEGRLDASVLQDGKGQGEGAVKIALAALAGEKPDTLTAIPFVLVTPENIADYE